MNRCELKEARRGVSEPKDRYNFTYSITARAQINSKRLFPDKIAWGLGRGMRSRGAECAYGPPVSKKVGQSPSCAYARPEIWYSMFLPQLKKSVRGGGADGADSKTHPVIFLLLIFSRPPKIYCYNPYLFSSKLNLSYQICVGFIFIYQKSFKGMFKITVRICGLVLWIHNIYFWLRYQWFGECN